MERKSESDERDDAKQTISALGLREAELSSSIKSLQQGIDELESLIATQRALEEETPFDSDEGENVNLLKKAQQLVGDQIDENRKALKTVQARRQDLEGGPKGN